ncbi:hypothetical protein LTS08_007979 [Lithohypha guttulata]|nr:hypothetical protein LTS08_007979 [Lithohypha guttulata]
MTPTLQELQDDIDLYQTLLRSLDDDAQSNGEDHSDDREYYKTKLNELNEQVASLASRPVRSSTSVLLDLPSRKRDRGEFDNDLDNHRMKSRKPTPADSPALSGQSPAPSNTGSRRADSVGSEFFDDPSLGNLLGDNWQDDVRRNREFLRKQEAKRRQEEEDAMIARQLQEQWNAPALSSKPQSSKATYPSLQQTQATFNPNGSFKRIKSELPDIKAEPLAKDPAATPVSISSSASSFDDDLTATSPSEWQRLNPEAPSRVLPNFTQSALSAGSSRNASRFTSQPGTSVYGSALQPGLSGIPSLLSSSLPTMDSLRGLSNFLGSQMQPFDLTRILGDDVLPPSWETPLDAREVQEEIRQLLHNIRPDEEIDISEAGENQPEGLKVRLMPHQVKGLAWMRKMEESSTRGGILADDMGLGKTVQAISLMLSRPPPDDSRKPTLIVTPVALMDQWKREINKMVRSRYGMTIEILHGSGARRPWRTIKHYDVILTSYGTLASEFKRKLKWEDKLRLNPDATKTKKEECAVLDDESKFHRVILDEAQNIRNRNTQASIAACRIQSTYRWCLSGTPMQNSVNDVYSLIRFCRIRPYNEADRFNKDIGNPLKRRRERDQERAMEKLQALLKAILLRRTKKSEVDGKPILQLPEKHTVETRAVFSKDQCEFYKALETQSKVQFNKFVKTGTVGQNYSKALVLLLRLRQCCCSPQLVTNSADFVTDSGVEGTDIIANAKALPAAVVNRIKEQEDIECPICIDAVENPVIFNPCGHALCHDCFSRMIDSVHVENAENVKCPHCRAKIDSKKITDYASFKDVYMGTDDSRLTDAEGDLSSDSDPESDVDTDGSDSDSFWNGSDDGEDLKNFVVPDDEEEEEEDDDDDLDRIKKPKKAAVPKLEEGKITAKNVKSKSKKHKGTKKKSKGKKKEKAVSLADLRKEGLKSRAAKKRYLRQLGKLYEPCAKIDKTLELLNEIHQRGEGEKTIVFSSFTSFLDLIEVPLSQEANLSNYTRYDGSMTANDRNAAVLKFTDDPRCRTMLVSLKAGNAGLNLTIANHVLILDPFWNPFVEYQAADRCYRIGQRREVTVHRVLIGEEGVDHEANPEHVFTVEDRILQLQEKKRQLVENALDENAASQVSRLGVRELGYLFGVNDMPATARGTQ